MNFERLLELINSDDLNVTREEDVFDVVVMWINHDKDHREKYRENLFKAIRFNQMDKTVEFFRPSKYFPGLGQFCIYYCILLISVFD